MEDGVITGQTTAENPTKGNIFLVWEGGELDDFELKVDFRIESGNSGIQVRSFRVDADSIIIFCDGGGRHLAKPHLHELEPYMQNGVGLGCIHYRVEIPKGGEGGGHFLRWIGGFFETHWSVNPHWTAEFTSFPDHPVAKGLEPFEVLDEWYYHMRFTDDEDYTLTSILKALPPKDTLKRKDGPHSGNPHVRAAVLDRKEEQTVCWVVERPDGGPGFGFTGAHFHHNWANDNFRKTVLNGITWISQVEVPERGVPSPTPTGEQLLDNQDFPRPKKK